MTPDEHAEKLAPQGVSPLMRLIGNLDHRPVKRVRFPLVPLPDADPESETSPPMVGIWALTDDESRAAVTAATEFYKKGSIGLDYARQVGLLDAELRVQTLLRALRDPDQPLRAFAARDSEVRRLSSDVQDALHTEYLQWLDERSPLRRIEAKGLDAYIDALLEALKKGEPAAALVSFYDTGTLRLLVGRLAHLLLNSTTPNSSASSSASTSPLNSSAPPVGGAPPESPPSVDGDDADVVRIGE